MRTRRVVVVGAVAVAAASVVGGVLLGSHPGSRCVVVDGRADGVCTPGVANPGVTQQNISTTVCVPGFTAQIRPSSYTTNKLKSQGKRDYGEQHVPNDRLEEDHLIPLELGGHPSDPRNLWPEPRWGSRAAADKDTEEDFLHAQLCSGKMTLIDAQSKILADWRH